VPHEGAQNADTAAVRFHVWIDAQLPPVLAQWLLEAYRTDALHVEKLGLLTASDQRIFSAAREAHPNVVLLTKDEDFLRLLRRHGPPPQIAWIRCGNVRNFELRRILLDAWPKIVEYLAAGEPLAEVRARSGT
jgi:predicted nuclease of predicted toxin-antitoxin system